MELRGDENCDTYKQQETHYFFLIAEREQGKVIGNSALCERLRERDAWRRKNEARDVAPLEHGVGEVSRLTQKY